MRILLIIKIIAALLVLGAMMGTAYMMEKYTGTVKDMPGTMMERQQKIELALKKKAEQGVRSDNEPGEKAFQRAKELLAMESMVEAEEKLKYIVSFYPSAKSASQARKILGEINIDRLLDPEFKEGKKAVKVKSGDSYTAIVRKHNTTFDSLVHLSRLKNADPRGLRAGQKLTVMPLDLRVVIDTRRETLTLWRGGEFVKEYPILKISYNAKKDINRLKVGSIRGWYRDRLYPGHSEYYRASSKVILLSDKSLSIRALPEDDEEDFGFGFYLDPTDMEELPLILRPGNDIEIRNR
ncbi:MAG: LysM peptidoglycan-binding domain-containing protein [Akkermansiaceae bacterium]